MKVHGATSTNTVVESLFIRSAEVGTCRSVTGRLMKVAVAYMLGFSRRSGLVKAIRTLVRLVSGSRMAPTKVTVPFQVSPGYAGTVTSTFWSLATKAVSDSGTFAVIQTVSRLDKVSSVTVRSLTKAPAAD